MIIITIQKNNTSIKPFFFKCLVFNAFICQKINAMPLIWGIFLTKYLAPDLISACASANPHLVLKNYCQDLLKTRSGKLALKRRGQLFLRLTLLNKICRSFPFNVSIYGRRVFKWITQWFTKICTRQFTGICTIFQRPKKACLKASSNLWSLWKWSGCVCVL